MITGAVIRGDYRYTLTRRWKDILPMMVWCMLNPSTADATINDPTIKRCIWFAMRDGYGSILVVNLMAYRATNPIDCLVQRDPCGPENDAYLRAAALESQGVIAVAWGANAPTQWVDNALLCFRQGGDPRLRCLGVTKDGNPRHPLYISGSQPFMDWSRP